MDVTVAVGDDAAAQDAGFEVRGPHLQLLHSDVRPDVLRPEAGTADRAAAGLSADQPRVWDRQQCQQCHLVSAEAGGGGGGDWHWCSASPPPPSPSSSEFHDDDDDDSSHPPV